MSRRDVSFIHLHSQFISTNDICTLTFDWQMFTNSDSSTVFENLPIKKSVDQSSKGQNIANGQLKALVDLAQQCFKDD